MTSGLSGRFLISWVGRHQEQWRRMRACSQTGVRWGCGSSLCMWDCSRCGRSEGIYWWLEFMLSRACMWYLEMVFGCAQEGRALGVM